MAKKRGHTIALLSGNHLFRQGLRELLHSKGFERIHDYTSSQALLAAAQECAPDLLVLDLDNESEDTMTLVGMLRHKLPKTHLVVLGTALRAEAAGSQRADGKLETPEADAAALVVAAGFGRCVPTPEQLRQHALWSAVTPRQRDVLKWLSTGVDNQAIARKLRVGERIVKAHLSLLLELFGVRNRTQLALIADHAGLRPPQPTDKPGFS